MASWLNWFRNAPASKTTDAAPAMAPLPDVAPARAPLPAMAPARAPTGTYLNPPSIPMQETPQEYAWRIEHEEANKRKHFTLDQLSKYLYDEDRAKENAQYAQIEMEHEAARMALMNAKKNQADAEAGQKPHVPPLVTSFASPFNPDLSDALAAARHAQFVSESMRGNSSMKAGKRRKINRHYKSKRSNKSKSKKGKKSHRRRSTRNH